MTSEKTLLERAHRFDEQALAELYDTHSSGIYRYAMRLLGDEIQAEECVSETFSRFLRALKNGGGPRRYIKAYLYRIAHNWITDQYRKQPENPLPLEQELYRDRSLLPPEILALEIERQQVRYALENLTPDQRQVIVLRYLEGWKNDEIAQALDKPIGAVKSLHHRGINALRRCLTRESKE